LRKDYATAGGEKRREKSVPTHSSPLFTLLPDLPDEKQ
jgi:hypothetical protein